MKLILCFKDIKLGTLDYDLGEFKYNSNTEGEKIFKQYLNSRTYNLFCSKNKIFHELPEPFSQFVKNIKEREDLSQMCVGQGSNDFDILCNYANLNQDRFGFNLKVE